MKWRPAAALFIMLLISMQTVVGDYTKPIEVQVPNDATIDDDDPYILVLLADPQNSTPLTGMGSSINIDITNVYGTAVVSDAHPTELSGGIYLYNATAVNGTGGYIVYASAEVNGTTYFDAALFTVVWDIYTNFSTYVGHIDDLLYILRIDIQNNTHMLLYQMNQQNVLIQSINTSVEEKTILDRLRDSALNNIFNSITMILFFIVILVLGGLFSSQRKTRKLIRTLSPANAAEKIAFGSEPVYTKGPEDRRNL